MPEDMSAMRKNAGKTIRKIRNVCGKTLEEFSDDAGYCRSRLSAIEREGTMDLETMMRINSYSTKSIFSFLADILPEERRQEELSIWFAEINDAMVTDMIERDASYREAADKKKSLSAEADKKAEEIMSYSAGGFETDERHIRHILSLVYHYTVISLKNSTRKKKDGTPVSEDDREFYQLMAETAEKLISLAIKAEKDPDCDIFGWIDYSFPSYTFPYVKELSSLQAIYLERLLKAAWYRLDAFLKIKYPGKKRKTIRKDLLKKDISSEAEETDRQIKE